MKTRPNLNEYLKKLGIEHTASVIHNPDYGVLFAAETQENLTGFERATVTQSGAVAVDTGVFTERSPADKYFVRDEVSENTLWWNDGTGNKNDNKAMTPDVWRLLKIRVLNQLTGKTLYVVDAWCGANTESRLGVRFILDVN